jgi:hypothetical protein
MTSNIPPRRIIVHTAVAHVHAIDDGIAKRPAALDDLPTHGAGYSHPLAVELAAVGAIAGAISRRLR